MKDILKILESAEADLQRAAAKVADIDLSGLAEDVSARQRSVTDKLFETKNAIRAKKLELLKILGPLADRILHHDSHNFQLPHREFGPYRDRDYQVRFVIHERSVHVLTGAHREAVRHEHFVPCYEQHYFVFCNAVIEAIRKQLADTGQSFEAESAQLNALREQLMTLMPMLV